jgi:hypothetical protein
MENGGARVNKHEGEQGSVYALQPTDTGSGGARGCFKVRCWLQDRL